MATVSISVYSDDMSANHELCCYHVIVITRSDNNDRVCVRCDGRNMHYNLIRDMMEFLGVSISNVEHLPLDDFIEDDIRLI